MQLTLSARSVVASVSLVGLGMLASPWRASAPQDPRNLDARLRALEAVLTPQNGVTLMKTLPHMRVVEETGPDGATLRTIVFEEVNVQITNGLGATNGFPAYPFSINPAETRVNGLGNLIVGYNETRRPTYYVAPPSDSDRAGSHNIIVGIEHHYSSFGGLVVGQENTISGAYSSISGGEGNTASGSRSSISGGDGNTASGAWASVSGGYANTASGDRSSVSGGQLNTASGDFSSVSGGRNNRAIGTGSSVNGGSGNDASGLWSSINGGSSNTATDRVSSVSGGQSNNAGGIGATIIGGCGKTTTMACEVQ